MDFLAGRQGANGCRGTRRPSKVAARVWLALALVAGWGAWQAATADSASYTEYQVKAAFLFNLVKFTEWPDTGLEDEDAPITIGIVGEDPFGEIIDETVRDERVDGHPIRVHRARRPSELVSCHVVFVPASERGRVDEILDVFEGRSVLTVGETEGFAERGGIVNFKVVRRKVRMEVNLAEARHNRLKLSSRLLKLCDVICGEEAEKDEGGVSE